MLERLLVCQRLSSVGSPASLNLAFDSGTLIRTDWIDELISLFLERFPGSSSARWTASKVGV